MKSTAHIATLIGSVSLVLLCSCAALRPATVPIRAVELTKQADSRCMFVLLPGRFSGPESLQGFADSVRERDLAIDLVAVDAHLGYYRKRTVIERVRADVVLPAREAGYERIWIAGTSLGGLGAILYQIEYPNEVSGIYAIAAFLGEEKLIDEIQTAGGPDKWVPPDPSTVAADDVGRQLWTWILKSDDVGTISTPLHLGWGTRDDFDRANRMFADRLPPDRVYTVDGGHDMDAWTQLWENFLDEAKPCGRDEVVFTSPK